MTGKYIEGELFAPTDKTTGNEPEGGMAENQESENGHCLDELFERLAKSKFRSSFKLRNKELEYIRLKGIGTIRRHAADFVATRLAPANLPNDGRQTPMRGHPVFLAQHATACCCRGCFEKWHHIPKGRSLTEEEQRYAVGVIMEWITRQIRQNENVGKAETAFRQG